MCWEMRFVVKMMIFDWQLINQQSVNWLVVTCVDVVVAVPVATDTSGFSSLSWCINSFWVA